MTEKAQSNPLGASWPHTVSAATWSSTATQPSRATSGPRPAVLADGGKPLDIKVVRVTPKGVVARIGGVADRNAAEALRGTELYAPRARLPEAEEGEYYYADLAGLRADDEAGNRIGSVVGVQNYGAGELLEVRLDGQSVTELVAFTDAFVPVVDIAGGRVVVVIPASADDAEGPDEEEAG